MTPAIPPIRTDIFAFFILLGIVQGLILSYFFISNSKGSKFSNLFLGILMLGLSLIMTDVWLGYTNHMFQVLWLVDSTEPINLMLAPLAFLYKKTGLSKKFEKKDWIHFLPALLYFLYMCLLIYPQSLEFKYNSNLGSFHPDMNGIPADVYGEKWMFFFKRNITGMTLLSMVSYDIAAFVLLKKAFRKKNISFFSNADPVLAWYRNLYFQLLVLVLVFVIVRVSFPSDLGDHLISAIITLIIYATSLAVFRRSMFFQETFEPKTVKKYEKSSLTEEIQNSAIKKLEEIMIAEKPYLDPAFSMPALARRLGVSTHHLSQILNEELGQSFFDFLATYRVSEAQKILTSEKSNFIKIEEIAQMVGYNSKSAFNTAFRKITGLTPSEFKKK